MVKRGDRCERVCVCERRCASVRRQPVHARGDCVKCFCGVMGNYLRLVGALAHNLVRRAGEDLADCAAICKRGLLYKFRSIRLRYDDVGPSGSQDWSMPPEQLALLVETVRNKPWFCELDRKAAQDLVHHGGSGCFLVRPSASTKSLTLTLWYRHRPYNILIRQREDGLLALGSKKSHEMTFHSVEEMVNYYEREFLILYSGGECTGRTRLKAPAPGIVRGGTSSNTGSFHSTDHIIPCESSSFTQRDSSSAECAAKCRTNVFFRTPSDKEVGNLTTSPVSMSKIASDRVSPTINESTNSKGPQKVDSESINITSNGVFP